MQPQQIATIIERTLEGATCQEIGNEIGRDKSVVSRRQSDPRIRAIIDQCAGSMIVSGARRATANILDIVRRYDEYRRGKDRDMVALSLKYSAKIAESMGVLASPAPSIFVQQIFNQTANVFADKAASTILDKLGQSFQPAIEAEVIDYESEK